jgi:eukaryotic-like serine/threonine-protein kinase
VPADKPRYRFGPFELDTNDGVLSRSSKPVKLQDLPFRLLVMLVERPGEIITREDVCKRLWPDNTFVEFDRSLGVAVRKVREALNDDAETPRYLETIPRRGFRFLAPVTVQGYPARDGATAQTNTVASTLGTATPPETSNARRPLNRYLVIAGIVVLVVGAGLYTLRSVPRRAVSTADARSFAPPVRVRRSVAVLGFRNLPGRREDNWLSAAFCEMLSTDLAAGGDLRLVAGEDVARASSELPHTEEDTLSKSTLHRLRIDPGADMVVLGSYTTLPGEKQNQIRLDLRLQDTGSGETVAEESVTGSEADLFGLVSQASRHLRQRLGVASLSADANVAVRASLPANQDAVRLYAEGRGRAWAFDFIGARDLLLKAIAADANYPLAHSALAEAWDRLGYAGKARIEAKRALDLSQHLPEEERLLIEGQYWASAKDSQREVDAYRRLFNLFPDNLEYGLHLATAQRATNAADSSSTLFTLRHLPLPAGDDPRIELAEASLWIDQDFKKAHAAAESAVAKGQAQGLNLIVARGYGILCQQGTVGESTAEAITDCENARRGFASAGDRNNAARTLNDLAGIYFQNGDIAGAQAMWQKARAEFRDVGDVEALAATANNLGDVSLLQGELPKAKDFLEQALRDYKTVEDKDGMALALNDLGDIARLEGDLASALTRYREAKAVADEAHRNSILAYVFNGLGDVLFDQADLGGARRAYEQSLSLRTQAGEKHGLAEVQVALAELAIEEGHAAETVTPVRGYKSQFHQEQQADDELLASAVLIDALLAEGKINDAQQEADASSSLAAKCQNIVYRLEFALASARVLVVGEHFERARTPLEHILREARAHGLVGIELKARLAVAQLAQKSKNNASAKTELSLLMESARAKGFGLILRDAAALRQ